MCEHHSPTEHFYVIATIPQNQTAGPVVSNPTRSHLPRSSASWLLLKINPQKRLRGRKTSLLAFSQNQDQMLSWNAEPPPAGPYKNRQGPGSGPESRLDLDCQWVLCFRKRVRCFGTYSVAWFQLCTLQEPLYSEAFVCQLALEGGGLPGGHGHILQRPRQADHPGFGLGRRHD